MTEPLTTLSKANQCSLYELPHSSNDPRRFIGSTPESRAVCNDPFVVGLNYTSQLEIGCAKILREMQKHGAFEFSEANTTVLHILRGGLNFGLRGALGSAFSWNKHASAFISAQRARQSDSPEDWYISENSYQKVYLPQSAEIIFGDVVATGTSLEFALKQLLDLVDGRYGQITGVLFFTIGGRRSEEILSEMDSLCRAAFPLYRGSAVVYLEGRFDVATPESKLSVKYTGTDLLRSNSTLAPEFIESQFDDPSYPIERCTIYDAGSRAFWLPEYLEDVKDYWEKTLVLAQNGVSYDQLLTERFPELGANQTQKSASAEVSLEQICKRQIAKCSA